MRLILLIISFVFFLSSPIKAQEIKTFQDSVFEVGDWIIINAFRFQLGGKELIVDHENNQLYLDSLKLFIKHNPELLIEVGYHSDSRVSDKFSSRLSSSRAKEIKNALIKIGLNPKQIKSTGYGDTKPIIKDYEIEHMETDQEVEKAHQVNRRAEITILSKNFSSLFTLTDTTAYLSSKYINNRSIFHFGSEKLNDQGQLFVDSVYQFLVNNPKLVIAIDGHLDERVSAKSASRLSKQRAEEIKAVLIEKGIPEDRLIVRWFQDEKPIIPFSEIRKLETKEAQEKAHQRNRRIEIIVVAVDYVAN